MTDEEKNRSVPFSLQHVLPHALLTSIMYRATRVRLPMWKNPQIRWFIARYDVDVSEASNSDPDSYEHFNAFFTRSLRAGSRPLEGGAETVVCPADGHVSTIGDVRDGTLLQAKGQHYSLRSLLGGDDERATTFARGRFATIYLSPRDYHRVHMPVDGRLREMTYIPGRLFTSTPRPPGRCPVYSPETSAWYVSSIPRSVPWRSFWWAQCWLRACRRSGRGR